MRLNKFESGDLEPLGEGDENKVFVDPDNEEHIISERKIESEKDTPRQLKGRYYLTKIAHLLLPKNIPDVYQAGKSQDGTQTVDREKISSTPGHEFLQEQRRLGKDEESARQRIVEEMGAEMGEMDIKLEDIGLGLNIDSNVGNYAKDNSGNVYYLETFRPWRVDPANPEELEVLFDEEELRESINSIPEQKTREEGLRHLERLLVLLEEERRELTERYEANLLECGQYVTKLEEVLAPFMREEVLASLNALKTEQEARNNKERAAANKILGLVLDKLEFLENKTDITDEELDRLQRKYKIISNAVGVINRGVIDHNR